MHGGRGYRISKMSSQRWKKINGLAEEERDEAIMLNIQMKKMKEELEEKARKLEERREKELARAREEARAIVKEAREVST